MASKIESAVGPQRICTMKRQTLGITCMAWNKDCSMIALCPNTSDVHIYETNGSKICKKWGTKPAYILTDHTETVSSIDWSAATDFLVTCSHDRNAYVWSFDPKENKWNPSLVILRINRAATMCRWSPLGNKFAVASSAKFVPVCHYEAKHKWWVSKPTKKHKSTVLSVAWCPNNKFILTGSTDYRCRIISAFKKEIDNADDPYGFGDVFPKQHEFGEILAEFPIAKAWVHDVAWSPSAFRLAFIGHGSTIHFVQITADGDPEVKSIRHNGLPYATIEFLSNKCVVAAGFDYNPHIYMASDGLGAEPTWSFKTKVDKEEKKQTKKKNKFEKSFGIFEAATTRGETKSSGPIVTTLHTNTIIQIVPFPNEEGCSKTFATAGIDGNIHFWDLKKAGVDPKDIEDEED